MRKLIGLLAIGAFVVSVAAPASSATLTLSGSSMSLTIGALPPIVIPQGAPTPIFVSSGGGSFAEPAGVFATTLALPSALFTGVNLISGLTAAASNGTKIITAAGGQNGGMGGPGGLNGAAFVNVLFLFNLTVPLGNAGGGGTTMVVAGGLMVDVTGNLWTTGQTVISNITTGTVNTLTITGFDNRTAGHAGVIRLITPLRIPTSAAGTLGGFVAQTLTFSVPEPGTLLLLGSGIVGLGAIGRRKLRK